MVLKSIEFSNIYNFIEPQRIEFNSKSDAYVIMGDNATGKTNLLDIIDNVGHALYRKPNYKHLQTVVNRNSGSSIIMFGSEFTLNKEEYKFKFIVDVEQKCYLKQTLIDTRSNKVLFDYDNGELTSDVLSDEHITALKAFNIKTNGIFVYVGELDGGEDTDQLRGVRKCAKYQDFIEFKLNDVETMDAMKEKVVSLFNKLDIDVRQIEILANEETVKKVIQERIIDKKGTSSIKYNKQIDVYFHYDNYKQNIIDESRGTIKLFDLCTELYAANSDDYFVPRLIDEMSTSLSSNSFFHVLDEFITSTNRQLVFTTNNQLVLENKTLPKESVIFVEKTDKGSVVSKLSDYKFVRNDKRHNWRKLYNSKQLSCKCMSNEQGCDCK